MTTEEFIVVIPPPTATKEDWVKGGGEIGRIDGFRFILSPVLLTPYKRKQARKGKK